MTKPSDLAETIDIENQSDEEAEFAVLGGSPITARDLHLSSSTLDFLPLPAHSTSKYPVEDEAPPFAIFFRLASTVDGNLGWWVTLATPATEGAVLKRPSNEKFRLQADVISKSV